MQMLRGIGVALVLLAAIGFIRLYKHFVERRAGQYAAFVELLAGLERYISTTASSVDKYMRGERIRELDALGFYDGYAASGSLHGAYLAVKERLYVSLAASELLERYFSFFGRGYLDAELRSLGECIGELRELSRVSGEESARSVRVVSVFAVAGAIGIVIMMV